MAKVVDPTGKMLFEGLEEDAYTFVERNAPHIHITSGNQYPDGPVAQVVVLDDEEVQHAYIGGKWEDVNYDLNQRGGEFVMVPANKRRQRVTKEPTE